MNWEEARQKIKANVKIGTDVNTERSTYRFIESAGISGFTVRIGSNSVVKITWDMLEDCFAKLNTPAGYSGVYFRQRYPKENAQHTCLVHVVGRIFVNAGFAEAVDAHIYKTC